MHLIERYALASSSKIRLPYIYERFFPVPVDKYITFHPSSKESKTYDFWEEVIDIIFPHLEKAGIKIIQIGEQNDKTYQKVVHLHGKTNFGQTAYALKRSMLHFGVDSFPVHVASSFNVPIISLYSNNYVGVVGPYWGVDSTTIEPPEREKGTKPSFSLQEFPKSINTIQPEKIAKAICAKLGLDVDYPYEQVFLGPFHHNIIWEIVPGETMDPRQFGVPNFIIRMDYNFDESFLEKQLSISHGSLITKRPIDINALERFKQNIIELIYIVSEDHDPQFIKNAQKIGLKKVVMVTKMPEPELNKLKHHYMDYGVIARGVEFTKESINEIKGIPEDKLFYRTRKFTASNGKLFPSKAAWMSNKEIAPEDSNLFPVIDVPEFWDEAAHFSILKKVD
jgi:hypothetical protein